MTNTALSPNFPQRRIKAAVSCTGVKTGEWPNWAGLDDALDEIMADRNLKYVGTLRNGKLLLIDQDTDEAVTAKLPAHYV